MCSDKLLKKADLTDSGYLELLTPENLIKKAPFAFVVLNRDMIILSASPPMSLFWRKPINECIGKPYAAVFPEISEEVMKVCQKVLSTGQHHIVEISVDVRSDKEESLIASYFPIKDDSGETRFVLIILQNVSRRKKAGYSLKEEDKVFQSIVENLPEDFFMVDRDGFLLRWNKSFEALTGYTTEELSKFRISNLFYHENSDDFWDRFEKMFIMKKGNFKARILRKNGEKISKEFMGVVHEIDGKPCMVGLGFDPKAADGANTSLLSSLYKVREVKEHLEIENLYLREEIDLMYPHSEIIGKSKAIKKVLRQVEQVAKTDSTVLLTGETGTGKELLARSIHNLSPRKKGAMVKVNCAALPANLIENELFGHERGAFTGAMTQQIGRFEVANGSTIFLDEISEIPLELQAKLLRVLQEGQFERLGGAKTIKTNVRVVAATNRDLEKDVEEGRFREDLYYRLNVFPINVPALRERVEDIPLLVWAFVREFGKRMGKNIEQIPQKTMKMLQRYDWNGNIRELRNIVERAMIVSTDAILKMEPLNITGKTLSKSLTLAEFERNYIVEILEQTGWRVRGSGGAAEILDLNPQTLDFRMKKLGIKRPT